MIDPQKGSLLPAAQATPSVAHYVLISISQRPIRRMPARRDIGVLKIKLHLGPLHITEFE
ncbi:MAG: hypothetical protein CMM23_08630 [Rhodospirillaceae bacterium]|jgi:hypothetical protein|nr:hypothetical protein [Rhodospirillaceae bacterium]|tara:strand:- start:16784 stop:16963 length:180 start_codon:yes stop_codon:yes gene_type:complete